MNTGDCDWLVNCFDLSIYSKWGSPPMSQSMRSFQIIFGDHKESFMAFHIFVLFAYHCC